MLKEETEQDKTPPDYPFLYNNSEGYNCTSQSSLIVLFMIGL